MDSRQEVYYSSTNCPNFNEFGKDYHFIDLQGRQYMIAYESGDLLHRSKFTSSDEIDSQKKKRLLKCVYDEFGFIKLYVKLPYPEVKWFFSDDIDEPIQLYQYTPELRSKRRKSVSIGNTNPRNDDLKRKQVLNQGYSSVHGGISKKRNGLTYVLELNNSTVRNNPSVKVRLRQTDKSNPNRRTGIIYVSGLDKKYANTLLNK